MVLVEDPQAATIRRIVAEASAQLATAQHAAAATSAAPAGLGQLGTPVHVTAYAAGMPAAGPAAMAAGVQVHKRAAAAAGPLWVSPAPVSVKMRLFCLPYAGGVSENVFAR